MTKIIQKKVLIILACFLLIGAGFVLLSEAVKAELAPGSVQFDKDYSQEMTDYILSQPIVSGPFTGKPQDDMQEILPFFTEPLTKYDLSIEPTQKKQTYNNGEKLELNGKISYKFDSKESQKSIADLKNCQNCPSADIYNFPSISDVGIFVQAWRRDKDKTLSKKGDYLIDEFYAADNINLSENKAKDFSIKWQVPEELKSGDYYLMFFVNSNKSFNLAGSPFIAFYQKAIYDFSVNNDSTVGGVELDKNNILINGQSYVYRQPAPEIAPRDGKITVTMPLSNLSPEVRNAKVTYNLYGWGQEDPADLINSKQETKNIAFGEKNNLEFSFNPTESGSVYNLQIKANAAGSVSTANVRFVVEGMNRGIFRFLGQAKNNQGQMLPVFCLRNAAWRNLFVGKVVVTALNVQDKPLNSFTKEGSMRPEDRCFAIKDASWLSNSKVVKLQGEIYNNNGSLVDKKIASLSFEDEQQKNTVASTITSNFEENVPASKIQIVLVILLIISLSIGGYLILLRSKKE